MTTRNVTSCGDCPFNVDGESRGGYGNGWCRIDEQSRTTPAHLAMVLLP
jgi:hypothetical protein